MKNVLCRNSCKGQCPKGLIPQKILSKSLSREFYVTLCFVNNAHYFQNIELLFSLDFGTRKVDIHTMMFRKF